MVGKGKAAKAEHSWPCTRGTHDTQATSPLYPKRQSRSVLDQGLDCWTRPPAKASQRILEPAHARCALYAPLIHYIHHPPSPPSPRTRSMPLPCLSISRAWPFLSLCYLHYHVCPPSPRPVTTTMHITNLFHHPVIRNHPTHYYAIRFRKTHELHAPRPWRTARQNACPPARDEQREAVCSFTPSIESTHPTNYHHQAFPPPLLTLSPLTIDFPFNYHTLHSLFFLQSPFETLPQAHSCLSFPTLYPGLVSVGLTPSITGLSECLSRVERSPPHRPAISLEKRRTYVTCHIPTPFHAHRTQNTPPDNHALLPLLLLLPAEWSLPAQPCRLWQVSSLSSFLYDSSSCLAFRGETLLFGDSVVVSLPPQIRCLRNANFRMVILHSCSAENNGHQAESEVELVMAFSPLATPYKTPTTRTLHA